MTGSVGLPGYPTTGSASMAIDPASSAARAACGLGAGESLAGEHAVAVNAKLGPGAWTGDYTDGDGRRWRDWPCVLVDLEISRLRSAQPSK
jgi:hypothetical protein